MSRLTPGNAVRFARTIYAWLKAGGTLVCQEEANRRADICAACKENHPSAKDGACVSCVAKKLFFFLRKDMPATPVDKELTYCGVCGCELQIKVHIPLHVIDNTKILKKYPTNCWQCPQSRKT